MISGVNPQLRELLSQSCSGSLVQSTACAAKPTGLLTIASRRSLMTDSLGASFWGRGLSPGGLPSIGGVGHPDRGTTRLYTGAIGEPCAGAPTASRLSSSGPVVPARSGSLRPPW